MTPKNADPILYIERNTRDEDNHYVGAILTDFFDILYDEEGSNGLIREMDSRCSVATLHQYFNDDKGIIEFGSIQVHRNILVLHIECKYGPARLLSLNEGEYFTKDLLALIRE